MASLWMLFPARHCRSWRCGTQFSAHCLTLLVLILARLSGRILQGIDQGLSNLLWADPPSRKLCGRTPCEVAAYKLGWEPLDLCTACYASHTPQHGACPCGCGEAIHSVTVLPLRPCSHQSDFSIPSGHTNWRTLKWKRICWSCACRGSRTQIPRGHTAS